MPSTKKKTKKPVPLAVTIDITKKRKRNPPRTAFSKTNPSPHEFQPGNVPICPGGKPRATDHLLSKSLRIALCDRAPDEVCTALGLPPHSSWSQVLARKLTEFLLR